MAADGLHDVGEEWAQKNSFRQDQITRDTTVEVLLYDDTADSLADSDDIGDITTEPTTGNYSRQTLTLDSSDFSLTVQGGDLQVQGTPSFDVTGTTESVDAWAAVVDFQSDVVNAEGSQNPHLISSAAFATGDRDLGGIDTLNVNVNLTLD